MQQLSVNNGKKLSIIVTIYLIRHARQSSPLCNVNVPLADEGYTQSELVGQRLKNKNIKRVYSSDLIRAKMTAKIIRKETGVKEFDGDSKHELRETDFGDMTGFEDAYLKEHFKEYFEKRELMEYDIRIPGGENGEEVFIRMEKAIKDITKDALENGYENVAVVSHGGAIRCFLAGILGMPFGNRFAIAKNMENCSITEIRYNEKYDSFSVERINDYSHLEGHDELLRKNFTRTVNKKCTIRR